MAAFAEGIFRSIMFFFDQIIYGFIPTVYNFIMVLAGVSVFSEGALQKIADNIYGIIGLFVVFRLAFILISSIVNPDKLTDNQAGFSKIMGKLIIALILIVAIPYGFQLGYRLQADLVRNQVVEKLILGESDVQSSNYGNNMSYLALRSFLTCKDTDKNSGHCTDLEGAYAEAFFPSATSNGQRVEGSFASLSNLLNTKAVLGGMGGKDEFVYDYKAGLSTICGVVILFMLITLCFDVAVRSIKLGFLQMISPIAVIGYIEPTRGIFKTWLNTTLVTYFNLFIRIISIAFVAFTMSAINFNLTDVYGNELNEGVKLFTQIFLILGLLIFAKEAPGMVMNMLGLKEEGIGSINPLKKLGSVPFVGGAAVAGLGLGASLGAKGLTAAGGALGGGLGSKLRGGGFMSGAKTGGAAGWNKVPFSSKPSYGKMAGSVLGAGVAGGMAGYGSEEAKVAAIQKTLDENRGDVSSIFNDQALKSSYSDYDSKKGSLRTARQDLTSKQNGYSSSQLAYNSASNSLNFANNKFSQVGQMLSEASKNRDNALARSAQLKKTMDDALASGGSYSKPYLDARDDYNSYTSGTDYNDAINNYSSVQTQYTAAQSQLSAAQSSYTTAESNLNSAHADLQAASAAVASAEREFTDSETMFKAHLDNPANKKDAEKYKTYKAAKDRGQIT